MADICKVESEVEVKCSPHKFYEWVKYSMHHLPAIFPDVYKEGQVLEGNGEGSLIFLKYVLPGTTDEMTVKGRAVKQDDENMRIEYFVEEGDVHNHYSHFTAIVQVSPKGEGSLVKWTVKYEKQHDEIPDPHHYLDVFNMLAEKIETHVLKP